MAKHAPALVLALVLGCATFTEPQGAERYDPPAARYTALWTLVADCAQIPTSPTAWQRIAWYAVPNDGHGLRCGDEQALGCWHSPHEVYLVREGLALDGLVQHEMLHDLLGAGGHPPVFDRCTNLTPPMGPL